MLKLIAFVLCMILPAMVALYVGNEPAPPRPFAPSSLLKDPFSADFPTSYIFSSKTYDPPASTYTPIVLKPLTARVTSTK